jgi:hypothetical protein
VCALAAVAWVALGRAALDSLAALALSVPAAVGVSAFAISLPGVADDEQPYSTRVHDGCLFGVVLVAVALGVFGLAVAAAGRSAPAADTERRVIRWVSGSAAVVVVLLAVVVVARGGGPGTWFERQWNEFRRSDPVSVDPSRLGSLSANNRWAWWTEAWEGFTDAPLVGHGAGTFFLVDRMERDRDVAVTQPHNVPLQFLTDTGIVGFLLGIGAFACAFAGAAGTVRRLQGAERGAVLALTLGAGVFCVHTLVDFDWDFLAVTGPVCFLLGAAVPLGTAAAVRRPAWVLAAAAFAFVAVSSLFAPWLANRRVDSAYDAIGRGDYATGAADADSAHGLNPLSAKALLVWGLAEELGGDEARALRRYRDAVDRQPDNADTWFALGAFELETLHDAKQAYEDLSRARELDPYGSPELDDLLGRAREQLQNAG